MRFNSILFVLDHRLAVFAPKKEPNFISLERLPKVPLIPSYCHLGENHKANRQINQDIHQYVKGFFIKQAMMICMPDDAPVFADQKMVREFFIERGAGTNSTVMHMESLLRARETSYVAVSRSERLVTVSYRRNVETEPVQSFLPLSIASPEAVSQIIKGYGPEIDYNETEVFILDPDEKLQDYYELGVPVGLSRLAEYASELAENNWL